jgi:thiamine biosynthesis lipoprotein
MKELPRFLFLFLLPLALSGCAGSSSSLASGMTAASSGTYYAMDTVIGISVGENSADLTSDILGAVFSTYDALADNTAHHEGVTNVYDLNQTNEPLTLSPELFDLLKFSSEMQTMTSGYFNPLIGGLSDLWKKDLFNIDSSGVSQSSSGVTFTPSVPSEAEIQAELSKMNGSSLVYDAATYQVQRLGEGKIDLGGIAKGYAGEKAHQLLVKGGVKNYLINAGASTVVLGENGNNANGTFGVDFAGVSGKYVLMKDVCIGTSGVDQQSVTVDGKLYSHVINPINGSALVDWYGVVLAGQDAGLLDALTTTFMVMGPELAEPLRSQYSLSAMFYKADISSLVNKGFTLYDS